MENSLEEHIVWLHYLLLPQVLLPFLFFLHVTFTLPELLNDLNNGRSTLPSCLRDNSDFYFSEMVA
jgi:hypothetical protein